MGVACKPVPPPPAAWVSGPRRPPKAACPASMCRRGRVAEPGRGRLRAGGTNIAVKDPLPLAPAAGSAPAPVRHRSRPVQPSNVQNRCEEGRRAPPSAGARAGELNVPVASPQRHGRYRGNAIGRRGHGGAPAPRLPPQSPAEALQDGQAAEHRHRSPCHVRRGQVRAARAPPRTAAPRIRAGAVPSPRLCGLRSRGSGWRVWKLIRFPDGGCRPWLQGGAAPPQHARAVRVHAAPRQAH